METLISKNPIRYSNSQIPRSIFLFHFPSLSLEKRRFLHFPHRKWLYNPQALNFSSLKASSASELASYGGWDDPRLVGDSVHSGESKQFSNFLVSIGIDDKKYIFMFLLGLICALAISRVRLSSIIVFPASVLVFAVGYSVGLFRRVHTSELNVNGSERRGKKNNNLRGFLDNLANLLEIFEGFEVEVGNLKEGIDSGIDNTKIKVSNLKSYAKRLESIRLLALHGRRLTETTMDIVNSNDALLGNENTNRSKDEVDLWQIVGSYFGKSLVSSKPTKSKDKNTREAEEKDQTQPNDLISKSVESSLNSVRGNKRTANSSVAHDLSDKSSVGHDGDRKVTLVPEDGNMRLWEMGARDKRFIDSKVNRYQNNAFMNKQRDPTNMAHNRETKSLYPRDNLHNYVDFHVSMKHTETKASFVQEQLLRKSTGAYASSHRRENTKNETYRSQFIEERMTSEENSSLSDKLSKDMDEIDPSSSSLISDDVLFDRYLAEANNLVKQAKVCMKDRCDDEQIETILYKSATLLSKAISMKPMSLLATGQLGNTYLLHGELKLKISRELRNLLSRYDSASVEMSKVLNGLDGPLTSKEKIVSVLINICEEGEELLVEAGRKYRTALSIDGNDVRALYNWGLALSFRAQLIADIGPEAAFDADKLFLAAIDKFDAMLSKGKAYAPDALFKWGTALQQRSRLRPISSKERVKLLQQAKRLYEDALQMESDNFQVRESLLSCMSELD